MKRSGLTSCPLSATLFLSPAVAALETTLAPPSPRRAAPDRRAETEKRQLDAAAAEVARRRAGREKDAPTPTPGK